MIVDDNGNYILKLIDWATWINKIKVIEEYKRILSSCRNIEAIGRIHQSLVIDELSNPASSILHIFSHISEDIDAALNQKSSYNQRLALRNIVNQLNNNLQDFIRSDEK